MAAIPCASSRAAATARPDRSGALAAEALALLGRAAALCRGTAIRRTRGHWLTMSPVGRFRLCQGEPCPSADRASCAILARPRRRLSSRTHRCTCAAGDPPGTAHPVPANPLISLVLPRAPPHPDTTRRPRAPHDAARLHPNGIQIPLAAAAVPDRPRATRPRNPTARFTIGCEISQPYERGLLATSRSRRPSWPAPVQLAATLRSVCDPGGAVH
jgi:hypothetical protein